MTARERRSEADTLLAHLNTMREAVVRDCGGTRTGPGRHLG